MRLAIILFFFTSLIYSQEISAPASLNSNENILKFADFLFCSKDYFRASLEYERYLAIAPDDTITLKAALGYSNTGNYDNAGRLFQNISSSSPLFQNAIDEYYKMDILKEDYDHLINGIQNYSVDPRLLKLLNTALLLDQNSTPSKENFRKAFMDDTEMLRFYEKKINPETKNPLTAGLLSALIPGAGKVYTERYADAVFSFISTGLLVFLSYDNFSASHEFRGWLFAGLASLFYAGNIYGSAASANEFNAAFRLSLDQDIKLHLQQQNYFMPDYDFCR